MIIEKMSGLVSRYGVLFSYVCRIPTINKYISTPSPLEIGVCEESFRAGFRVPIHHFIKGLLNRYDLVPNSDSP